ncbi:hypothetical protein KPH14_005037 [Odynerus spinipes]|uniref:Uncharacterized protein n=1 Tax=Odynerus spinipes TaxID=1348599 RepID=A0AAD9RN22_9HYME|nr:hypothetical protein KPH14_005037 [Odynerus spinipes]
MAISIYRKGRCEKRQLTEIIKVEPRLNRSQLGGTPFTPEGRTEDRELYVNRVIVRKDGSRIVKAAQVQKQLDAFASNEPHALSWAPARTSK